MVSSIFSEKLQIQRTLLALLAIVLAGALLLVPSSPPAEAATTFTVNTTDDAKDMSVTDSECDASSETGIQCTLRAAIQQANYTPNSADDPDLINFDIGGTDSVKTIDVGSTGLRSLPTITRAVTINGYSQPGAQENTSAVGDNAVLKVELNGTSASTGIQIGSALTGPTSNVTVKGLVINRFSSYGILIQTNCDIEYASPVFDNKVEGNFIGTDASGIQDLEHLS
jgi:hypothetical protein